MRRFALACLLSSLAAPAVAQQDSSRREIKALSPEQVAQYRAGEGMGFALAAELNHYPGPRHVLELADSLDLTEEQHRRIVAAFDMMRAQAIRLGERIIEQERLLDQAFRERSINERQLRRMTEEIGRLQGALRAVHLAAHLSVTRELTAQQVTRYERLRAYERSAGGEHRH